MSKGRRKTGDARAVARVDHRIRALRQELERLEKILDADEGWRALAVLDKHPERHSEAAVAARARLLRALERNPVYGARAKLLEVIALLTDCSPDYDIQAGLRPAMDSAAEPKLPASVSARGWRRSLSQSIADLIDLLPGTETAPVQVADNAMADQARGAAGPSDGSAEAPMPRSLNVEEAEVWIVERSRPRPEFEGTSAAGVDTSAAHSLRDRLSVSRPPEGLDASQYAAYRDTVEEASVEIVYPGQSRRSGARLSGAPLELDANGALGSRLDGGVSEGK